MTDVSAGSSQVPLDAPLREATFGQAFSRFFKKYATFHGRASRSEFWWWFLAYTIISGVLYGFTYTVGNPLMVTNENGVPVPVYTVAHLPYTLWWLATVIPWLALSWRRLHDTNRPGPWWFLWFVPIVGQIILLVFFLQPPKPEGARFDR